MSYDYPFDKIVKHHFALAAGLGLWIFLFFYVTEPLGIDQLGTRQKLYFTCGYMLFGSLNYFIALPLQHFLLKSGDTDHWGPIQEFLFILISFSQGAILVYLFFGIAAANAGGSPSFLGFLKYGYLPALIIILPFVIVGRFVIGKIYGDSPTLSSKTEPEGKSIVINGKGKLDFIKLNKDDLLFLKSSNNYVEVNYVEGTSAKSMLIRTKLSEIELSFPGLLLRVHRSYLVNPTRCKTLKTISKRLFVCLEFGFQIPVSRNLQGEVKAKLPFTTK